MTYKEQVFSEEEREQLGRLVREEWIDWAREQPNPKPSWLVPWEELSETDREVDRRIGARLALAGIFMADDGDVIDSDRFPGGVPMGQFEETIRAVAEGEDDDNATC